MFFIYIVTAFTASNTTNSSPILTAITDKRLNHTLLTKENNDKVLLELLDEVCSNLEKEFIEVLKKLVKLNAHNILYKLNYELNEKYTIYLRGKLHKHEIDVLTINLENSRKPIVLEDTVIDIKCKGCCEKDCDHSPLFILMKLNLHIFSYNLKIPHYNLQNYNFELKNFKKFADAFFDLQFIFNQIVEGISLFKATNKLIILFMNLANLFNKYMINNNSVFFEDMNTIMNYLKKKCLINEEIHNQKPYHSINISQEEEEQYKILYDKYNTPQVSKDYKEIFKYSLKKYFECYEHFLDYIKQNEPEYLPTFQLEWDNSIITLNQNGKTDIKIIFGLFRIYNCFASKCFTWLLNVDKYQATTIFKKLKTMYNQNGFHLTLLNVLITGGENKDDIEEFLKLHLEDFKTTVHRS